MYPMKPLTLVILTNGVRFDNLPHVFGAFMLSGLVESGEMGVTHYRSLLAARVVWC